MSVCDFVCVYVCLVRDSDAQAKFMDVNAPDSEGNTVYHAACEMWSYTVRSHVVTLRCGTLACVVLHVFVLPLRA